MRIGICFPLYLFTLQCETSQMEQEGPATHLRLVFIACRRYETNMILPDLPVVPCHLPSMSAVLLSSVVIHWTAPNTTWLCVSTQARNELLIACPLTFRCLKLTEKKRKQCRQMSVTTVAIIVNSSPSARSSLRNRWIYFPVQRLRGSPQHAQSFLAFSSQLHLRRSSNHWITRSKKSWVMANLSCLWFLVRLQIPVVLTALWTLFTSLRMPVFTVTQQTARLVGLYSQSWECKHPRWHNKLPGFVGLYSQAWECKHPWCRDKLPCLGWQNQPNVQPWSHGPECR